MTVITHYIADSDVDNWPDGATDTEKKMVMNRVEERIEKLTKDFFYEKVFNVYIDGNGKDRLFLGLIPDIVKIIEIKISGIVLPSSWWTYNKDSVYLNPETVAGETEELAELHLRLRYERVLFPKGMGNIRVVGTHGRAFPDCPAAIKQATVILCQVENDPTLYPAASEDFKSEKLGDYSYTRRDGEFITGISRVDKLLRPYIKKKPMMGCV